MKVEDTWFWHSMTAVNGSATTYYETNTFSIDGS